MLIYSSLRFFFFLKKKNGRHRTHKFRSPTPPLPNVPEFIRAIIRKLNFFLFSKAIYSTFGRPGHFGYGTGRKGEPPLNVVFTYTRESLRRKIPSCSAGFVCILLLFFFFYLVPFFHRLPGGGFCVSGPSGSAGRPPTRRYNNIAAARSRYRNAEENIRPRRN